LDYIKEIDDMRELIIGVIAIVVFFYIIFLIMEYKTKNFIYEKYTISLMLIMMASMYLSGFKYSYNQHQIGSYGMLINVILAIVILGGYIIFQKNRIYLFKGIDKKLVRENKSEIIQIIEDYKSNCTDSKSDITYTGNRVVFEKVNKAQAEECLSIIGEFLDKNRREYKPKDYLIYFIKGHLMPAAITIAAMFILFKLIICI
jgi:hypothetical protein